MGESRIENILESTIAGEPYTDDAQSRIEERLIELKEVIEGGGGGGTTNYNSLANKPQINSIELTGDKSSSDLGLQDTISDLAAIRSNASAGAGAAEVVAGIDKTGNNYIEMKSGQREYLSTTVPTGDIPTGSVGMGFDEGVWTYKSGTKVSEGEPTANLFDMSFYEGESEITVSGNKATGTCDRFYNVKLSIPPELYGQELTWSVYFKRPDNPNTVRLQTVDNGSYKYGNNIIREGRSTVSFTATSTIRLYVNYGSTGSDTIELSDIMLNEGSATLPYEPYGAKKFPFYANGQNLTDYTIYGNTGGVGDKTGNLFDVRDYSVGETSFITKRITLEPNTTYTMSSNCPLYNLGALIAIGNVGESFNTANNGVYLNRPISRTTDANGELIIGLRTNGGNYSPADYDTILNVGSTPLPYEPYGYKIPVICGGQTTNIYLDSPLGANDSIDYTTSQVAIPTTDGANNLICDTIVQPSKVSLTYTGWHSDLDEINSRLAVIEQAIANGKE